MKFVQTIFNPYEIINGTSVDVNIKSRGFSFFGTPYHDDSCYSVYSESEKMNRIDSDIDTMYDGFCEVCEGEDGNIYAVLHRYIDGSVVPCVWCRVSGTVYKVRETDSSTGARTTYDEMFASESDALEQIESFKADDADDPERKSIIYDVVEQIFEKPFKTPSEKYQSKKCSSVMLRFSPAESDVKEYLDNLSVPKATYIKDLIRKDMKNS